MKGLDLAPIIVYPTDEMLAFAGASINPADYGSCDNYEGKRKSIVLIPKLEGATTYIVVSHLPVR
ncbi:hypothetical protein ACWDUN_00845 [Mycobacterium sp. NPDC003323]